jgi:hypothetical protein
MDGRSGRRHEHRAPGDAARLQLTVDVDRLAQRELGRLGVDGRLYADAVEHQGGAAGGRRSSGFVGRRRMTDAGTADADQDLSGTGRRCGRFLDAGWTTDADESDGLHDEPRRFLLRRDA